MISVRAVIVGLLITAVLAVLPRMLPAPNITVGIDLWVSNGSQIDFYVNDVVRVPEMLRLTPGQRRTYPFKWRGGDLHLIRIDLLADPGSEIRLFGIQLADGDQVFSRISPGQLAGWERTLLSDSSPDPASFHARALGPRSSIETTAASIRIPRYLGPLDPIVRSLNDAQNRLRLCLIGAALAICWLSLGSRSRHGTLVVLFLSALVSNGVMAFVLHHPHGTAPASDALGRSTYLGLSLPTNSRAIAAEYLCAAAVAILASGLVGQRGRRRLSHVVLQTPHEHGCSSSSQVFLSRALTAVLVVATVATFMPDFHEIVKTVELNQFASSWDLNNVTSWNAFSANGLVAMKDFWYPYGNFSLFGAYPIAGAGLLALYHILLILGYWWVFWIASNRRLLATSACASVLLLAQPLMPAFDRYGLALLIALAFLCIDPDDSPRARLAARAVFGGVTTLGLFIEPVQVAYAGLGVVVVVVVDLIRGRRRGFVWWLRRLGFDGALPSVGLVIWLAISAARGQLQNVLDFYTTLRASAAYSALPTDLLSKTHSPLSLDGLILWAPAAMIGVGGFVRLTQRNDELRHGLGSRFLVCGAVALPLLQKHAVRSTDMQLISVPIVALILAALWASGQPRCHATIGAVVGLGAAVVLAFPGPRQAIDGTRALPRRLVGNIGLLATDPDDIERATKEQFAPDRFATFAHEQALARDLRPRLDPNDKSDLFILGDAPVLYVLAGQRPPWQVNIYNTSPVDEQRKVVRWIDRHRPHVVVVDRTAQSWDDVPHAVRIPLVFQRVIKGYVFDHSVGPFDVLRPRALSEPPDAAYWARALSLDLNLGWVPNVSSYRPLRPCEPQAAAECGRFLVVRPQRDDATGSVTVPVRFDDVTVVLSFHAAIRQREYVIPLARTWTWAFSTEPVIVSQPSAGWEAKVVPGRQPSARLY